MAEEAVVMNEDIEMGAFQIIAAVGTARSCYIEAIHAAKAHDYEKAEKLIAQGDESFNQGHDAHLEMLGKDAASDFRHAAFDKLRCQFSQTGEVCLPAG